MSPPMTSQAQGRVSRGEEEFLSGRVPEEPLPSSLPNRPSALELDRALLASAFLSSIG